MKGTIYLIINKLNAKYYIGSTNNFTKRKRDHMCELNKNKHVNSKLQNAWNKYGESEFLFVIFFHSEDVRKDEQLILDKLDLRNCYNISPNSVGGDITHTFNEERRNEIYKKISDTRKERKIVPPNRIAVSIDGVVYNSYLEAAQFYNINSTVVRYRCMSKNDKYLNWNIVGIDKTNTFTRGESRGTIIICEGVEFPSYAKAARYYKLSITAIQNRVKSKTYPEYYLKERRTTIPEGSTIEANAIGNGSPDTPVSEDIV